MKRKQRMRWAGWLTYSEAAADMNQIPGGHRARTSTALPREEYNYVNYIAYCLYPPLYVAGPIMTFNDFMWQVGSAFYATTGI
jgi:hypothetical protein